MLKTEKKNDGCFYGFFKGPWWALRRLHLVLTVFLLPKNLATKLLSSKDLSHDFILSFLWQFSLEGPTKTGELISELLYELLETKKLVGSSLGLGKGV